MNEQTIHTCTYYMYLHSLTARIGPCTCHVIQGDSIVHIHALILSFYQTRFWPRSQRQDSPLLCRKRSSSTENRQKSSTRNIKGRSTLRSLQLECQGKQTMALVAKSYYNNTLSSVLVFEIGFFHAWQRHGKVMEL